MMQYISYDDYTATATIPDDLLTLITEYEEMLNAKSSQEAIVGAWQFDKPVSKVEIRSQASTDRVIAFLEALSQYFYFSFDGFSLYLSRFPQLAEYARDAPPGIAGVLYGYPLQDVAQYCLENDLAPIVHEPASHQQAVSTTDIAEKRERLTLS